MCFLRFPLTLSSTSLQHLSCPVTWKVRFYLFGSWKWKPGNTQKLFANFLGPVYTLFVCGRTLRKVHSKSRKLSKIAKKLKYIK